MRLKRTVPALAALLLLVGAAYLFLARDERAADPLSYLPGDTLALVDVRKPAALYATYRRSRLGKRLGAIRWDELWREFGAGAAEASASQARVAAVQEFLASPLFEEFFSRRAVLALLPPTVAGQDPAAFDPRESLALIARPRHRTDVVALLAPLLAADSRQLSEAYQGREIRVFTLADNTVLAVAASDGLLVAAFSVALVKRCLDLGVDPASARHRLSGNPEYQELRKRASGQDEQFVYGDAPALARLLFRPAGVGAAAGQDAPWPLTGYRHGALFCAADAKRLSCTAILRNVPGKRGAAPTPAESDAELARLPAQLLFHFWTNLLDLPRVVAALRQDARLRDQVSSAEFWLARKSGVPFPELWSLFGNRLSLTVAGMRGSGFFPLPRFCACLAVQDQQRLSEALAKLLTGKEQTSRKVAGVRVNTLPLAGGLLQPSYAISEGLLTVADSPEQLEQCLGPSATPLISTEGFRRADVGLAQPSNMVSYTDCPRFLDGLGQLSVWAATLFAMTDQEQGKRVRAVVDRVVTPVLDGLKMYAAGSSRLTAGPTELVLKSVLVFAGRAGKEG